MLSHWLRAAQEDHGLRVRLADPEGSVPGGCHLTALTEGRSEQSTSRAAVGVGLGAGAGDGGGARE